MLNTLNNDKNVTKRLENFKYPFPHQFFILNHPRLQHVTLTKRERGYLLFFKSILGLHWCMFHQSGLKSTPVVLQCPTMKVLVETAMQVSQGEILMFGGDSQWIVQLCLAPELISRSNQPVGTSSYPYKNLTTKLLTTNNRNS